MLWAFLLAQSIVALKQDSGVESRHFSTLAVPHATSKPFETQADVNIVYYKYSPTLEQTKAYDLAVVSFELKGDGQGLCMMVSSHELPITPQNLSACHGDVLRVSVPSTHPEFCAPSTDPGYCSYFIGVRYEGSMVPDFKIGVSLQFTEPLYRHLYLSQDVIDHLQPTQRFKYIVPAGMVPGQVIFNVYTNPVMAVTTFTELLVSLADFPSGNSPQIGVVRGSLPGLTVTFNRDQLKAFLGLYTNLTFFLTLVVPSVPESTDYSPSPSFTLKTRVLSESGQPIPQPTQAPPSWRRGEGTTGRSNVSTSTILWVWTARFLGVLALCLLISCIIKSVKYLCKSRAVRQAEALGDLLHQSKQNIEDAWSRPAQTQPERDVELQQVRETTTN